MVLSYQDLENMADATMRKFSLAFFGKEEAEYIHPTPIDHFAHDFLNLEVRVERLCMDESVCGITAYTDTILTADMNGIKVPIPIKQNEVLLDIHFMQPKNVQKLCGKRRFTLAHECAHQLLYQLESDDQKAACRRMYKTNSQYTARELKTKEDWNEWQANVVGAAIIMPRRDTMVLADHLTKGRKLKTRHGALDSFGEDVVAEVAEFFHVSASAARIRLERLGYMERPSGEQRADTLRKAVTA